jgi:N-acyl-L-homoserine lactone synthetase
MHCITFDFLGQHRHGDAFHQYLQLRKRYFVDVLDWDIPHDDAVEMDQYDNPRAHYSLVLRGSTVVGGARVMPTTATWGQHSYMLRDAHLGRIPIPKSVVPDEIVSDDVWECTRLVVSDDLATQAERQACLSLMLWGCGDIVGLQGGREVVSLSPVTLLRTLRQLGFPAARVGEPYREADGRQYALFRTEVITPPHAIAAE